MNKKVLVVLSGCGVYDGSEIHESVLTLLALDQNNIEYQCVAPNIDQFHVINHTKGETMEPPRNVLVESARIARGEILDIEKVQVSDYDGIVLPGGFGAAKNWSTWAFDGPAGTVNASLAQVLMEAHSNQLPIAAFCMSPVVLAKAFQSQGVSLKLTVGSVAAKSPYEIEAISEGMNSVGAQSQMATVDEIVVDDANRIITSPCYMMEASIAEIHQGIQSAIAQFSSML